MVAKPQVGLKKGKRRASKCPPEGGTSRTCGSGVSPTGHKVAWSHSSGRCAALRSSGAEQQTGQSGTAPGQAAGEGALKRWWSSGCGSGALSIVVLQLDSVQSDPGPAQSCRVVAFWKLCNNHHHVVPDLVEIPSVCIVSHSSAKNCQEVRRVVDVACWRAMCVAFDGHALMQFFGLVESVFLSEVLSR